MRSPDFSRHEPPYRWTLQDWHTVSRKLPWPNLWWGTRVMIGMLGLLAAAYAGAAVVVALVG